MRLWTSGLTLAAALALASPLTVNAQTGSPGNRGERGMRGHAPAEMIMRLRDRLELTEDQIAKLDAIRAEAVQRRTERQARMEELRSQVVAGQMERSELLKLAKERRDASKAVREQTQERIQAVLTDAQKEILKDLQGRARAFRRGRALGARQGRASRGHRRSFGAGRGPMSRGRAVRGRGSMRGRGMMQGMRARARRGGPAQVRRFRLPPDTTQVPPAG